MNVTKGLRWSGQTIGRCRRRFEASPRQFSSFVRNRPIQAKTHLFSHPSFPRARIPVGNVGILSTSIGLRFASSAPATTLPPTPPTTTPTEAVSASASAPISEFDSATNYSIESLYDIPESIGYLKALGLEYGYGPTALVEWVLEHIHIYAGTPWFASIALTAVFFRLAMFKLYVNAAENSARMATIAPITKPLMAKQQAAARIGDTALTMEIRAELQAINRRAGVSLLKGFAPFTQMFVGYGSFVLLRAMSRLPVPGLETGGLLWFSDLTIPDPTFTIPLATAGVLWYVLKKGGEMGVQTMSPEAAKLMTYGFPLMSFLFTFWLPAAVQISFFVSGLMSAGQATLFRRTWFRDYFNMTPLPTPPKAPTSPNLYPGKLKLAAKGGLSKAELDARFEAAQGGGGLINDIKTLPKMMKDKAIERQKQKLEKDDASQKTEYERKRQEEERERIKGIETRRMRERQAAKRRKNL